MRVSSPAGHFKGRAAGARGVRRAKAARLALALACCLLLTACPPEGGDLVPLPRGEGAERVKTEFEGDTLRVARRGVTLKARGRWSVADGATSVILEISNANAESLYADFKRCEMVNDVGERMGLRSASDDTSAGGPDFLPDKAATIGGQEERRFALEFKVNAEDGRSGVPRNLLGRTVALRLPFEIKAETPAQVDFVFEFKCAEYQRRP